MHLYFNYQVDISEDKDQEPIVITDEDESVVVITDDESVVVVTDDEDQVTQVQKL